MFIDDNEYSDIFTNELNTISMNRIQFMTDLYVLSLI